MASCKQTNSAENELIEEIVPVEEVVAEEEQLPLDIMDGTKIESAHLKLVPSLFKMKLENSPGITLLDIRTAEELAENGFIEGAQNLDFYNPGFKNKIEAMSRDMPVMLYCRSGGRSGEAAAMMKEMGFKQVYDLNGGYNAWLAEFPNK